MSERDTFQLFDRVVLAVSAEQLFSLVAELTEFCFQSGVIPVPESVTITEPRELINQYRPDELAHVASLFVILCEAANPWIHRVDVASIQTRKISCQIAVTRNLIKRRLRVQPESLPTGVVVGKPMVASAQHIEGGKVAEHVVTSSWSTEQKTAHGLHDTRVYSAHDLFVQTAEELFNSVLVYQLRFEEGIA